jgi:hypothetical protein
MSLSKVTRTACASGVTAMDEGRAPSSHLVAEGRRALADLRGDMGAPFDILHAHFAYSHLPALFPWSRGLARATVRSFYGPWAMEGWRA